MLLWIHFFKFLFIISNHNWTGMQIINQARATNGVRVQLGFKQTTKLCLRRGFIPLSKYYVIVTRSSPNSLLQTSGKDNHTANSCGATNIFKLDVIKNHRRTSSKILLGNIYEMIMESIDYGRDLPSASDIVSLKWLFECGPLLYMQKNKDILSIHMHSAHFL